MSRRLLQRAQIDFHYRVHAHARNCEYDAVLTTRWPQVLGGFRRYLVGPNGNGCTLLGTRQSESDVAGHRQRRALAFTETQVVVHQVHSKLARRERAHVYANTRCLTDDRREVATDGAVQRVDEHRAVVSLLEGFLAMHYLTFAKRLFRKAVVLGRGGKQIGQRRLAARRAALVARPDRSGRNHASPGVYVLAHGPCLFVTQARHAGQHEDVVLVQGGRAELAVGDQVEDHVMVE